MEFTYIGKIVNTFGIKGEVKVLHSTDFVEERFKKGSFVYIGDDKLSFKVKSYRFHKGFLLVTFEDYEDINLIEKYKNQYIYKSKDDIKPLKKGEYYFSDLKDLNVYVDNELIGRVLIAEEGTTSNYLRILKADNNTVLVPFLPVFIDNVDLDNKRIDVIKMDGLL